MMAEPLQQPHRVISDGGNIQPSTPSSERLFPKHPCKAVPKIRSIRFRGWKVEEERDDVSDASSFSILVDK